MTCIVAELPLSREIASDTVGSVISARRCDLAATSPTHCDMVAFGPYLLRLAGADAAGRAQEGGPLRERLHAGGGAEPVGGAGLPRPRPVLQRRLQVPTLMLTLTLILTLSPAISLTRSLTLILR